MGSFELTNYNFYSSRLDMELITAIVDALKAILEEDKKEDFKINILSIDEKDPVKNIFFEIIDNKLLNKTNGIVQGMSGSPIIQNNKIIGMIKVNRFFAHFVMASRISLLQE